MVSSVATLVALPALVSAQGHRKTGFPRVPVITAPTGLELVADEHLPESFDWRDVNGRNFVTADVNQHIPQYCGSCWIHGTVAALNDRLKISRSASFPDIMLARQTLLNCVPGDNNTAPPGCMGGEPVMIYTYMRNNSLPDETCNVWKAKQDGKCEPFTICNNCDMPAGYLEALSKPNIDVTEVAKEFDFTAGCKAIDNYIGYHVGDYGFIEGPIGDQGNLSTELAMMKEIYANGPLVCAIDGTDEFMLNYTEVAVQHEGVFMGPIMNNTDHDIEVVGWGETASGQKYWQCRNSWGTYWGEAGWFKLARGINQNNIETDCAWAKPYSKDLGQVLEGTVMGDYHLGIHRVAPFAESLVAQPVEQLLKEPVAFSQPLLLTIVALLSSGATILASRFLHARHPGSEPLLA